MLSSSALYFLLAGLLAVAVEYEEALVAVVEEVGGPAVGIDDVVLDDFAVFSNARPQRRVELLAVA